MTNKEAIDYMNALQVKCENGYEAEVINLAIKALDMVERLENMRDNTYRLYNVEKGDDDYSYGRKQVLGTVHSDLEELLEGFDRGGRE